VNKGHAQMEDSGTNVERLKEYQWNLAKP